MLREIKGNAKYCLLYEPMFLLAYNLFITYASVYMLKMGLSKTQIGLIVSINLVLQIVTSLISGYYTDRWGRKRALLVFDVLGWSMATLIWAISQNFWFFLLAACFNSFGKAAGTPWNCLLVEGTEPHVRPKVYTILQLIGMFGGLLAPLGGLLVDLWGLTTAGRIMYMFAFLSMTIMFILRNWKLHETETGIRKQKESLSMTLGSSIRGYWSTLRTMMVNPLLLIVCGIYILFQFQLNMRNTYLSVYMVDALQFGDSLISLFPAFSSSAALLLMIFVIPRFKQQLGDRYMMVGFGLSVVSYLLLIFSPPQNLGMTIASTILYAAGTIISTPYLEASLANNIEDDKRASIISILAVFMLLFIAPSGIIGGYTYEMDSRIPFILMSAAFLINIVLMLAYRKMKLAQKKDAASDKKLHPNAQF
ncbi:MFS transporter [Paenibacillus cremeus]|uniref:MFS transporter n=1 Tax=Paenibacillus cremeus TaxID=2163881 RepID=A0A559K9S9_9BACL|nr:MFS transporter [Paenibacillus cremeus]TVY08888.1 MFS transporter [Paenibacillus cremeus]